MTFTSKFVEDLRRGDSAAFVELIERMAPMVRKIVRKYHFNLFDQEEAIQEVWLNIYRRRESLSAKMAGKLVGWVATVARNKAIDVARSRIRRPEVVTEDLSEKLCAPAQSQQVIMNRQLSQAVATFAAGLEPAWRAFFNLHFVEGLGYPETSRQLGITRLRCRYMKRVIAAKAREDDALLDALGRSHNDSNQPKGDDRAS